MHLSQPKNAWVETLRTKPFYVITILVVTFYVFVNLMFATLHYLFSTLTTSTSAKIDFLDYIYYAFVTSSTIGYGDIYPNTTIGKLLVILQSSVSVFIFSLFTSIIFIKLIYPRNTIRFSKHIIYNKEEDMFLFRLINVNQSYLVNPEIRVVMTTPYLDESQYTYNISLNIINKLCWLDNKDIVFEFKNKLGSGEVVYHEICKAREHNLSSKDKAASVFRIYISIHGNYGFQTYSHAVEYKESDIVSAECFGPISYTYLDNNITPKYSKETWDHFDKIIQSSGED